jgi:hypothetical protein
VTIDETIAISSVITTTRAGGTRLKQWACTIMIVWGK